MLKRKTTKLLHINQPDADEITFHFRENTKQSCNLPNVALMQTSFKNFRNQHSNSNNPQNIVNSLFQIEITSLLKQGSCTDRQSNRVNQLSNTVEVFPSGFSFSQRIKVWKLNLFYYYIIYKGWSLGSWLTIMPNPSTLKYIYLISTSYRPKEKKKKKGENKIYLKLIKVFFPHHYFLKKNDSNSLYYKRNLLLLCCEESINQTER